MIRNSCSRQYLRYSRSYSSLSSSPEYAFEMAASSIRFGRGSTKEIGYDLLGMGVSKNVCIFTDPYMVNLAPVKEVIEALTRLNIHYSVFSDVQVEPTDKSLKVAIDYSKKNNFNGFIAVGGGSTIDTAKAANLYMCNPKNDFFDFVNAPIGKGLPVPSRLKPLIAVPTTAGTGLSSSL
jgi:hydroxyacid-oxoacid transhydrogenase